MMFTTSALFSHAKMKIKIKDKHHSQIMPLAFRASVALSTFYRRPKETILSVKQ